MYLLVGIIKNPGAFFLDANYQPGARSRGQGLGDKSIGKPLVKGPSFTTSRDHRHQAKLRTRVFHFLCFFFSMHLITFGLKLVESEM